MEAFFSIEESRRLGERNAFPDVMMSHTNAGRKIIFRSTVRAVPAQSAPHISRLHATPPQCERGGAALAGRQWQLIWRWLPGTIGGIAGFVAFHGLSDLGGGLRGVSYAWPADPTQRLGALLAALIAGIAGWLAGQLIRRWRQWLQTLQLLESFWWIPIGTGLLIGLCLWGLPLAGFSGESQLKPLVLNEWRLDTAILMLSAVAKLLMVGLCLETGWRGGQFFPVVLASSALGIGLHQWLPWIGTIDSWSAGVVGGCLAVLLNSPLLGLILGLTLLQGHGVGELVIGLLVVGLILQRKS